MAVNIIDTSFQTCVNADLDAENGLPEPKQTEGAVLLVVDTPQAIYIYHDGEWVAWTL